MNKEIFRLKIQLVQGKLSIISYIRKTYNIRKNEVLEVIGYPDHIELKPTGTTVYSEVL